ncbi:MAG: D-tyrosyl-tRNA(Tyr) deacylase [Candidatus Zixiibacteriota bacterium]|nr:MAG: D-tyrosyl-tRNA(Tyr) deacylase [candidate division Zixibacteria bacterium]HDL02844.1 D-tyrosyl-tRNA(Tyr) deacylase [candidate division Zixibacteria bacterium]
MKLLIQRVSAASVSVDGHVTGSIGAGFLILAGFRKGDVQTDIKRLSDKCLNLRVFEDDNGKMNRSLIDIRGELLIVSQFTLYANCKKGRRPGFDNSMPPDDAEKYYNLLLEEMAKSGLKVEKGVFGAKMEISLVNDGPVTIMLDGDEI